MDLETPPHCALDRAGLQDQGARYARLAATVTAAERSGGALTVEFGPEVDRELLERTLAIERECCPFFELELDARARRLRASVSEAEHEPALDALAAALS
jgi:hypothetical protein